MCVLSKSTLCDDWLRTVMKLVGMCTAICVLNRWRKSGMELLLKDENT